MLNIKQVDIIEFSNKEYDALDTVQEIFSELQKMYPTDTTEALINPLTRERVEIREFGRIRGIINFIKRSCFMPEKEEEE